MEQDLASHSGVMALHPSPGWSAEGWKGTVIALFFFLDPGCFDDATDNPHVFLADHWMTNMGKYLDHCQGKWRKSCFQETLWTEMIKKKVVRRSRYSFSAY